MAVGRKGSLWLAVPEKLATLCDQRHRNGGTAIGGRSGGLAKCVHNWKSPFKVRTASASTAQTWQKYPSLLELPTSSPSCAGIRHAEPRNTRRIAVGNPDRARQFPWTTATKTATSPTSSAAALPTTHG